jgi:hypothetical protein
MTPGELAGVDQLLAKMGEQVTALVEYYRTVKDLHGPVDAARRLGCLVSDKDPVELVAWLSIAVARLSRADSVLDVGGVS